MSAFLWYVGFIGAVLLIWVALTGLSEHTAIGRHITDKLLAWLGPDRWF